MTLLRPALLAALATTLAACAVPDRPGAQRLTGSAAAVPDGPPITFVCGDTSVITRFGDEVMSLEIDGHTLLLAQAISASGARYTGLAPNGPVEFWNRGNEAMLTIGQRAYPTCVTTAS